MRLIKPDPRWQEPELPTPKTGMRAWKTLLRLIPGYDPWRDAEAYRFSRPKAHAAMRFFHDELSHAKGERAKTPFYLEPWEQAVIANLFGWVDRKTGVRRFRFLFLYVPRKNGKTPLCAAILMLVMYLLGEYGSEYYCVGHDYRQASHVFAHAEMMVRHNPMLMAQTRQIFRGQQKQIQLNHDHGFSSLKPLPYDPEAAQGYNLLAAAIDEVHTHPDGKMIDAIVGGTAGKTEPLIAMLTTADYEREESPCNKWHDRACAIRDGSLTDPRTLPVIYQAEKGDDWTDPKTWEKANPNLDVSVSREYLALECERAQQEPAYEFVFKRYHLNIRTAQADKWLDVDDWDACAGAWSWRDAKKRLVHVGIDLASVRDTTALTLLYRKGKRVHVRTEYWAPRERAEEREKRDRVPYVTWAALGFLTLGEGRSTDFRLIANRLIELRDGKRSIRFGSVLYDPHEAGQMARGLEEDHGFKLTAFPQYPKNFNEATKLFAQLIHERLLVQEPSPVTRWQIGNIALYTAPTEHVMPSKKRSADKIDGPVSAIMALAGMVSNPRESRRSVYDHHAPISV